MHFFLGQYFNQGAFASFCEMKKRLWGVGLGHIIIAALMIIYFNIIIAWAILYFIHSFRSPLPWKDDTSAFFYETIVKSSGGIGETTNMNWEVFGANLFAWILTYLVLIKGVNRFVAASQKQGKGFACMNECLLFKHSVLSTYSLSLSLSFSISLSLSLYLSLSLSLSLALSLSLSTCAYLYIYVYIQLKRGGKRER